MAQSGEHPESHHPAHPAPSRREVVCFDCRAVSRASARATSTQCSNCGTFIDLRDVEIKGRSTQRVRTRGDVFIHRKGALLGTAVHCGNLIVEGSVAGSIYAQNIVEFRTNAKVLGEIRCRQLIIGRKIVVTALQPVHVEILELEGELSARVFASGVAHIKRFGRLDGGLNAGRLRVDPGGEVTGSVTMGARATRPEPAPDPDASQGNDPEAAGEVDVEAEEFPRLDP